MLNVLLVDDEILALEDIKAMIDWEKAGFHIVGATTSVKTAVELYKEFYPELLITDIVMPTKSGADLAEELLSYGRILKIFFLTSYQEFSYAKDAIELGVSEYLVKNELEPDVLLEALSKAKEEILREQHQVHLYEQETLRECLLTPQQGQHILRRGFLQMLVVCPRMYVDFQKAYWWAEQKEKIQIPAGLENAEFCHFCWLDNKLIICVYSAEKPQGDIFLNGFFENVVYQVKENNAFNPAVIISPVFESMEDIYHIYKEMSVYYTKIPFMKNQDIYLMAETAVSSFDINIKNDLIEEVDSIKTEEPLVSDSKMQVLFQKIRWIPDKDLLDMVTQLSVHILEELYFYYGYAKEELFSVYPKPIFNIYELEQWYFQTKNNLMEIENYSKRETKTFKTRRVIAYIRQNYNQDISITQLAEKFFFSPSHLKRLFKKETGYTILDYITICRMEKAKEMLRSEKYRIGEISEECGYSSSQYFSKVFKQNTGYTPTEYQNRRPE